MVNKDIKREIHNRLLNSNEWLSGEYLSTILNVSRVAIWKHLSRMRESGYPVESSGSGYRLDPGEDTLAPWALSEVKRDIHHFPVTGSTMDEARDLAESGVESGSLVLAETQTSGRGRFGKTWNSGFGGLYFTIIEYPGGPLELVYQLNRAAVLAVIETLLLDFGIKAWCRDPGDILIKEGKIAGVLLEVSGEIERIRYVNIGIGINIQTLNMKNRPLKRRSVLEAFLPRYEDYRKLSGKEIIKKWNIILQKNQ